MKEEKSNVFRVPKITTIIFVVFVFLVLGLYAGVFVKGGEGVVCEKYDKF